MAVRGCILMLALAWLAGNLPLAAALAPAEPEPELPDLQDPSSSLPPCAPPAICFPPIGPTYDCIRTACPGVPVGVGHGGPPGKVHFSI